jgi:hypothetical protein
MRVNSTSRIVAAVWFVLAASGIASATSIFDGNVSSDDCNWDQITCWSAGGDLTPDADDDVLFRGSPATLTGQGDDRAYVNVDFMIKSLTIEPGYDSSHTPGGGVVTLNPLITLGLLESLTISNSTQFVAGANSTLALLGSGAIYAPGVVFSSVEIRGAYTLLSDLIVHDLVIFPSGSLDLNGFNVIPEPGGIVLVAWGLAVLAGLRRKSVRARR